MSDSDEKTPPAVIRPDDILSSDVPRRSFLRGFGIIAGTAAVTTAGTGCSELFGVSDTCDNDVADPAGAASDNDPTDPLRSDSDRTDPCDSD